VCTLLSLILDPWLKKAKAKPTNGKRKKPAKPAKPAKKPKREKKELSQNKRYDFKFKTNFCIKRNELVSNSSVTVRY